MKEDVSSAPQSVTQVLLTLVLNVVDNPLNAILKQILLVFWLGQSV
ncbi:serine/threonine transporter SstT [Rodentibacter pneumotropicus]|uniref:Serine/threonine transporter SstT n=1 Tax=Rodentibacter pneumotropicus TaxID=758 RepID=A0A448MR33_9PAST|nr:serine/threonine transporter SstT [Rodentibacter pneumotropicus]